MRGRDRPRCRSPASLRPQRRACTRSMAICCGRYWPESTPGSIPEYVALRKFETQTSSAFGNACIRHIFKMCALVCPTPNSTMRCLARESCMMWIGFLPLLAGQQWLHDNSTCVIATIGVRCRTCKMRRPCHGARPRAGSAVGSHREGRRGRSFEYLREAGSILSRPRLRSQKVANCRTS